MDTSSLHEIRESYDVASPDGIYPDEHAPDYRKAVVELSPELCELTIRLLKCMALALGYFKSYLTLNGLENKKTIITIIGLEEDFFSSRHRYMFQGAVKNRTIFRSLYYPKLTGYDIQPGVVRCGAHSDYGAITLLLQDQMGGLEVMHFSRFLIRR